MGYKAIICDLDGTLLNEKHRLSSRTKDVIRKVKDTGKKIFIATGRHHLDAMELKKQLGLDSYLISSNGARIHNEHNESIYQVDLDKALVKFILGVKCHEDISRHIYTEDAWYIEEEREEYTAFHQESGFSYTMTDFKNIDIERETFIKLFFISKNTEELIALENYFEKTIGKDVSITLSGPECLEIMAKGVSKGEAIKNIMKKLNIELENVMAFGDGLNDYEMLKEVGKGLLMGNCAQRLREKLPDYEVIRKNSEDGVACYLEEKFL